jgi:hypothetical protein
MYSVKTIKRVLYQMNTYYAFRYRMGSEIYSVELYRKYVKVRIIIISLIIFIQEYNKKNILFV